MKLRLTADQKQELTEAARTHGMSKVRIKALAILNVGRGRPISEVAEIFVSCRQSVYSWIDRYVAQGLPGLEVNPGRGRKTTVDAREIEKYVLQSPENFGIKQSRWTLKLLAETVPSLHGFSPSGVKRALARTGFSYKRGQPVQHSPDPDYDEKKSV